MTLPKNNSVTKFAFKPAETGYYMLTGSASAIPTGISVYQEEVKVTSAGKYGIYGGNIAGGNDQEYNLQGNVFSLYLHSAPRHYSGMLKLTKGVTYYYSIYDGNQEVTNLHMELIIYPIPFLLIFHHFSAEIRTKEESVAKLWRMLWMVPASFFFLWMVLLYFSGETSLERMMQPFYSIYLGIIDAASFFIYWITLSFVQESARERQLAQENHMAFT